MADERDGHTSVNSELLKRVAGSPSSGSTPSKRKKPQLEIAVTKKRSVGKSVAVQTESVQPILDPTTLPRLTASMTVAALKKEVRWEVSGMLRGGQLHLPFQRDGNSGYGARAEQGFEQIQQTGPTRPPWW